jgi:4-hydroxy-tetrahydrodipicolinate synthase
VYSGDDPTAMALMLGGGAGNISVTANVAPRAMADMCRAAIAGDLPRPGAEQQSLPAAPETVHRAESGAGQVGAGGNGQDAGGIRLPLVPLAEACHEPCARPARSRLL